MAKSKLKLKLKAKPKRTKLASKSKLKGLSIKDAVRIDVLVTYLMTLSIQRGGKELTIDEVIEQFVADLKTIGRLM